MNFKLNALVAAALMAASAPSLAAMIDATSGNGELLLNLRFYQGDDDTGANDMSAVFDLGVDMNTFLANRNTPGFTMSWDLTAANYGGAWNTIMTFAGANRGQIEYNVIALDSTNFNTTGGSRYLNTFAGNRFPPLTNFNLNGFQDMNTYVMENNLRGTHPTEANGASTAISGSPGNVYFGSVNGFGNGDNWIGRAVGIQTTRPLNVAQNFWFLTTSSTSGGVQAFKRPFGVDFNGNNSLMLSGTPTTNSFTLDAVSAMSNTGSEFGKWSFATDAGGNFTGTLTFANPVPEAETYAMMLAGLGLVGFMVARRRQNRA